MGNGDEGIVPLSGMAMLVRPANSADSANSVRGKSPSFLGPAQTRKGYRFRSKSPLLAVGWFVVRRPLGVPIKFTLTCPLLLTATLAVYDLLIRRIGVLRLLSGMKPTADTSKPTAG